MELGAYRGELVGLPRNPWVVRIALLVAGVLVILAALS